MPVAEVDGTTLEYVERGEGDPVVLVHGTLSDHRMWRFQFDAFAERFRTIAYSRRYHYPNPCTGNESDYSATLHADDLAALMNELGLESAHVVGQSYGAYTALLLAARHPSRVRSMVLGEPPVLPLLEHSAEGREVRDAFLADVWGPVRAAMEEGDVESGVRIFSDTVVGEGWFARLPTAIRDLIMENAPELKVEASSPRFWTQFACADAEQVRTPTLLLSGEQSLEMLRLIVDALARCLPNSESAVIPNSTHEFPTGKPEIYNKIVLDFLTRQGGR